MQYTRIRNIILFELQHKVKIRLQVKKSIFFWEGTIITYLRSLFYDVTKQLTNTIK